MAFVRTVDAFEVDCADLLSIFKLHDDRIELFEIYLRKCPEEHAQDASLALAVGVAVLLLFEDEVEVLIRDDLCATHHLSVFHFIFNLVCCGHNEACIDNRILVLKLVNIF